MNPIIYQVIMILASVSVISIIYKMRKKISGAFTVLKGIYGKHADKGIDDTDELYELIEASGYNYDSTQDIFYTRLDAWQREMGYTRLYDEAAAPLSMIIDCEPIYFQYDHKIWLIEFWKGQYGMTTGCEIGVYNIEEPDIYIPSIFNATAFYNCASDSERLYMAYYLERNGEILFIRKGCHWWLTGFKLGEFSEPSELRMHIAIILKDEVMIQEFIKGLKNAGYKDDEFMQDGKIVRLLFSKPHSTKPLTRTKITDYLVQLKNKKLCDEYQEITKDCITMEEKVVAISEKAPELLLSAFMNIGKTKELFR